MTAEDITQQDLVISKLRRQDIEKYRSLFPHVSAAIQLSSRSSTDGRHPTKGDIINYIYTNTQHKNPLLRVAAFETAHQDDDNNKSKTLNYDKEKYREMILDAAETVLGPFGFDRTVYGDSKKRNGKW